MSRTTLIILFSFLCGVAAGQTPQQQIASLDKLISPGWGAKHNGNQTDTRPVLLRTISKKGDTYRYKMVTDFEAIGATGTARWEMTVSETATKIKGGTTVWKTVFSKGKIKADGVLSELEETFKGFDGLQLSMGYDATGRLRSIDGKPDDSPTSNIVFPKKAVRPGESWPAEIEVRNERLKITYTYVGRAKHKGKDAIVIEGNLAPGQLLKSLEPTRFLLEPATGKPYVATGHYEMPAPANLRLKFSITRL